MHETAWPPVLLPADPCDGEAATSDKAVPFCSSWAIVLELHKSVQTEVGQKSPIFAQPDRRYVLLLRYSLTDNYGGE
jgi:hypothetical protein